MPRIGNFKSKIQLSKSIEFLLVVVKGPPERIIPFIELFFFKLLIWLKLIISE